ncbi:MAG: hypothetical protein ABJC13_23805 [Acidobacteriota bacterium]
MSTIVIVGDDGRVYRITLGDPGEVVELVPQGATAGESISPTTVAGTVAAVQKLMDAGENCATISTAKVIMGTFVKVPLLDG